MPSKRPLYATDGVLRGLYHQLRSAPDSLAFIYYTATDAHRELSWREVARLAATRAHWLQPHVRPGALVFIIHHDPLEQALWWLAALVADAVPGILTPPTMKLDRTRYRAEIDATLAAHPQALMLCGLSDRHLLPVHQRFLDIASWSCDATDATLIQRSREPRQACIFQQSSGTTGLRKGILLSELAVVSQLHAYCEALNITPADHIQCWLPLYHDMGLIACLSLAMYAGLCLTLTSPFMWLAAPHWWVEAAHRHRPTLAWLPNFAFNLMVDRVRVDRYDADALESFRLVINCSEPVLPMSLSNFAVHFAPLGLRAEVLSSCYAMAENTFAVTQTPPGEPISIDIIDADLLERSGRAVPASEGRRVAGSGEFLRDTELRVMRQDRQCSEREVGEIVIRSPYMLQAYVGIDASGGGIDAQGWFWTGDVGYVASTQLYVIGRKKDIIIRGGRNLDPTMFETAASSVPGVKRGRAVAIAIANERAGTDDLVLIVERSEDDLADAKIRSGILRACEAQTGTFPQKVEIVSSGWLAKSSSGKISRSACRAKYTAAAAQPAALVG